MRSQPSPSACATSAVSHFVSAAARRTSASPVPSKVLTPNGNSPCRYRHSLCHSASADWQAGLEAALAIQALHAGRGLGA